MRHPSASPLVAVVLAYSLAATPLLHALTPPEPPPGDAVDGDVALGAEPAGLDAGEWQAAMVGSTTGSVSRGAVQAILENPRTDLVYFYKNLNESLVADQDDAYHVFARRCGVRSTLTEDCDPADIVFDHLVFTRTAGPDGRFVYEVTALTAENPVGTELGNVTPVNPFGTPNAPGLVLLADADDPRRDPSALATFAEEDASATRSIDETGEPTVAIVRGFTPVEGTTYPYPYERVTVELDDADAGDIQFNPTPSGDTGVRGTHGALDVTQSRATLLVSGRAARRTALDPDDERALEIKHVDIAPTVASVLGIPPHVAGQLLNNGTAAENPAAEAPLIRRQDGKVLHDLLEPKVNTFLVVVDGLLPEDITATQTPNLCNLTDCFGATAPDTSARSTVYTAARGVMVTQTNANHTAMVTGAYGEQSGIVANTYRNRVSGDEEDLESPALIRVDTIFDVLRREAPHLKTAAVMGKVKLRELFDCTNDGGGTCITGDTGNPEGDPITHVRPDFLRGAAETPAPGSDDCPAEPAAGIAADDCIMDVVINLSAVEDPDFTFVNLGSVDGLQHVNGPNSPGATGAITLADTQIGRLVDYLKESGKWQDSVLIVTADHSFSWQGPSPLQRVDLDTAFASDPTITATGETFLTVTNGGTLHVYLDSIAVGTTSLSPSQEAALAQMRALALGTTGVSEAWYRLENSLDAGQTLTANRPDWHLDDQRAGDLLITALASGPEAGVSAPTAPGGNAFEVASGAGFTLAPLASAQGALQGDHGHPGARHVPFIVLGGGDHVLEQTIAPAGPTNEGDDTALNSGQPEAVDLGPTIAWIYGLDPATAMPDASGRILSEAFPGRPLDVVPPHANRAIIFIFDADNSVRIHELTADCDETTCGNPLNEPVPAVRSLLLRDGDGRLGMTQGTLTSFGSMASFPTVTFPNHNVVGSGVHPGHHGIVGNRYYERDIELERDPIDPLDPRNPIFFFSSALLRQDFETLHEAVHRAFGDWAPSPEDPGCDPATEICNGPSGAFTASVNEPSARGADFASLETLSNDNFPATFAFLVANSAEFVEDTNQTCSEDSPDGYGQESVLDHLGQAQGRSLYSEPTTAGFPSAPGTDPLIADETGGGTAHPDPRYLIENFTLTDGSGHEFGPHGACTRSGYGDTSSRLGRVLAELANHERFDTEGEPARLGETFIVLTGDHGMENQDPGAGPSFDGELADSDIEYVTQGQNVYLLTMNLELLEADSQGFIPPDTQTLTFRVTDDDVDATGSRRPIVGATVVADSGVETLMGTTDGAGEVALSFATTLGEVVVSVDRDGDPAVGTRTTGSTSQDPGQHGQVVKADFNELTAAFSTPAGGACAPVLLPDCTGPEPGRRATLLMRDHPTRDIRDRLVWRWGAESGAISVAEFGDPRAGTNYLFCAYDGAGTLLASAAAPAGGGWQQTNTGFRYRSRSLLPDGIFRLVLRAGANRRPRLLVKAKGAPLTLPTLPVQMLPITVQLLNGNGLCWEATYSTTRRNLPQILRARGDD